MRYGPGESDNSWKCPFLSVFPNADVAPSAETSAPPIGRPRSSCTNPLIEPAAADATRVTRSLAGMTLCARAHEAGSNAKLAAAINAVGRESLVMLCPRD